MDLGRLMELCVETLEVFKTMWRADELWYRFCSMRITRGFGSSKRSSRPMRTSSHNVSVAITISEIMI